MARNGDKDIEKRITQLRSEDKTLKEIAETLNSEGFKAQRGGSITESGVNYYLRKDKRGRRTGGTIRRKRGTRTRSRINQQNDTNDVFILRVINDLTLNDTRKVNIIRAYFQS